MVQRHFTRSVFVVVLLFFVTVVCYAFRPRPAVHWLSTTRPPSWRVATCLYGTSPDSSVEARQQVINGMKAFSNCNIQESIDAFNQAEELNPSLTPYLWQRGISYYYKNDFEKASQQFRTDVTVNPRDTEEIVWDIAAQLQVDPTTFPPRSIMSLPPNTRDRRRIMPYLYTLFRGEGTEYDLAVAGTTGSPADEFYALFYLGLYCEVQREPAKARHYLLDAVQTKYATGRGQGDYMTTVAEVHVKLRQW